MSLIKDKESIAENKLIILYIIEKFEKPVSNLQLTNFILENNLINYFVTQELLNDLVEDKYIYVTKENSRNVYSIRDKGSEILKLLGRYILPFVKKYIDDAFVSSKKDIIRKTSIIADFFPESEDKYTVHCAVKENDFVLFDVKIATGSKEDARMFCKNWEDNAHSIYPEIIESFLKKRS